MTSKIKRPSISNVLIFSVFLIILLLIGFIIILCVKLDLFLWNAEYGYNHTSDCYSTFGNNNLIIPCHLENVSSPLNLILSNEIIHDIHDTASETVAVQKQLIRPIKVLPAQWGSEGEQNPTENPVFFDTGNFRKNKAKIWDDEPQYKFDAFGKHFHLVLNHDSGFVHPEIKITSIFKNSSIAQEPNVNPAGCYYSGYLQNESSSQVIVSLCNGMTGHIYSENDSYFIQPAEPFDQNMDKFLHSIYRFESQNSEHDTNYEVPESEEHNRLFEDEVVNDVEGDDYEVHSHHRNRRSIDEVEKVVELMIVADKNMADYHKLELHNYILTIMSIVAKLFKDSSIGNPIKITVVEIGVLSEHDIVNVRATKEEAALSATLDSFCTWQENRYVSNQLRCKHHDCALLISREINCVLNDTNKCYDKLGLAQLGSMCRKDCCSIIRDSGLNTAFTIAHELGHMFNMPHDEDDKCHDYNKKGSKKRVMSSPLGRGTHPWKWSNCSRHFITEFLDAGNDACLHDDGCRDILKDSDAYDEFPGEKYMRDQQCYLVYGEGYTSCSHLRNCSMLWCENRESQIGCLSNGMPVADGTTCGSGHWCQQGDCVLKGKPSKPIDGEWGPWQPYGECSRSCGGGIKRSYRECDSPAPRNGGKFCLGKRVKFQSCNFKECPYGTMDFRAQQCAKFNNNTLGYPNLPENVRWVPSYSGANKDSNKKCKLYCKAENTAYHFPLEEKVIDGTPCGPNTYDICVNGVCMRAGCDHILNSTSVVDMCGICGGNNTTCRQVYKNFNVSHVTYGYTRLMVIPAGASNIDIQQRGFDNKKDETFLALFDVESNTYLFNGNFCIVRYPKEVEYDGIIISYSGSNSVIERINTSRPLRKDLVLEVLSVGILTPRDIVCRYTVPTSPEEYFKWDVTDKWTVCNKVCRGEQERIVRCARKDTNAYVSEESCSGLFKPTMQIKPCNQHCDLRWDVVSQSECSSFCGPGYRIMSYRCFQEFVDNLFARVELPDVTCNHINKPSENQTCVGPCDVHRWKYYEWQPCNVTCGNGIQTRKAVCVDQYENVVEDRKCETSEKITQKRCVMEKCPLWSTSDWSSCSVTCGMGERERHVRCQQGNKLVHHSLCSSSTKPVHKELCQMTLCARWITGEWSECSATCGIGERTRLVSCSVPNEDACHSLFKPSAVEMCSIASCTVATTVTNATTTTLTTSAFSFFPYSSTSNAVVTQTNEIANGELFFKWISGDWTSCSVSCGKGIRRRNVKCYDIKAKTQIQDYYCNINEMPDTEETCLQTSCVEWKTTEWSSCSASCGVGISVRNVWCEANGVQVADENCIHHKPTSTLVCDTSNHCSLPSDSSAAKLSPSSSGWRAGRWGECSSPCGGGIKIRHVICQDEYGNEVNNCDLTMKPEESVSCNMHPCSVDYRWKYSEWSECSSTCGLGFQRRFAWCVMNGERNVTDEHCASQNISTLQQTCSIRSCPTVYHWIATEWSECSVTCGTGFQKRVVKCQKTADSENEEEIVSHYFCNSALRPSTQRECALKFCPNDYIWVPEAWSECSAPCGMKGKQKRKLSCFHRSGKKTKKLYCKSKRKPSRRRKCIANKCEPMNCLELKHKLKTSVDGEYSLIIFGRNISIYCHQMWSDSPTEYLTLPTGENENFSEFFGKRLINPDTCPTNRKNKYNCPCIEETSVRSGKTAFSKIRLNLTSLQVITKDFTFSKQIIGSTIPFGEAGDCYSTVNCPQGSFSINLKGTGLRISTTTSWIKDGINASMHVDWSNENRRVAGKCGGYCAACRPLDGLKLDVLPP